MNNIQDSKIPPSSTTIIAKGCSAAYNQHSPLQYIAALQDIVAEKLRPTVVLPDISTLTKNVTKQLPLSSTLIYPTNETALFYKLHHSLISHVQLCDNHYQFLMDKNKLYDFKNEKIFQQGNRSRSGDFLWYIPITSKNNSPIEASANTLQI